MATVYTCLCQAASVLSDVEGIHVGHVTDVDARTGCTAVVLPEGTVASGEVRGGAPATRDFEVLAPAASVTRLDAVVLSGGSAFGLAACDGAMRWCEEHGRGFETAAGIVPIVVGLSIFDLVVGASTARPSPADGYAACAAATAGGFPGNGPVGAGAGATVGKWRGRELAVDSGIGQATLRSGDVVVSALVVVNAWGDVVTGPPASLRMPEGGAADPFTDEPVTDEPVTNTSIGVVATNATLTKPQCLQVA
jgi:L-aminopeptidase/D-esterase-like protein